MTSLVDEVGRHRAAAGGGRWVVENSPVGASASSGMVGRAAQSGHAQVRVLKVALEQAQGRAAKQARRDPLGGAACGILVEEV